MTFFGKILIVLILIFSVIFATLSLAVYSTHRHWQEIVELTPAQPGKPLGLKHQLENETEKLRQREDEARRLKKELEAETAAYRHQLQKLETTQVELLAERQRMETQLANRQREKQKLTDEVTVVEQNLESVDQQVQQLRGDIRQTQQRRDDQFQKTVAVSEEVYELVGQLERLEERRRQLDKQLAQLNVKMSEHDVDPHAPLEGRGPRLQGVVTRVGEDGMIQISLGADVGLRPGQTIEIFRGNTTYLGRAEVMRTAPNEAVAKVIPQFKRGAIRKGDHVATRIKNS